jgi:hypothetical protein
MLIFLPLKGLKIVFFIEIEVLFNEQEMILSDFHICENKLDF